MSHRDIEGGDEGDHIRNNRLYVAGFGLVMVAIACVLQDVVVEVGQRVTRSANLARVIDPARLKARLRVWQLRPRLRQRTRFRSRQRRKI